MIKSATGAGFTSVNTLIHTIVHFLANSGRYNCGTIFLLASGRKTFVPSLTILILSLKGLTEGVTYLRPLRLLLQDLSESGADVDVAHIVQQNPDHSPGQMHDAAEAHELAELCV